MILLAGRQLEKYVKDLQDSIVKKNPNSIAALIRAASTSESVQAERVEQADQLAAIKVTVVVEVMF